MRTFSFLIHSTSSRRDYASAYSHPGEQPLNGNYQGLNGLAVGDYFSRNSVTMGSAIGLRVAEPEEEIYRRVTPGGLTSVKAGLKYREIPANRSLRAFHEGDASGFM